MSLTNGVHKNLKVYEFDVEGSGEFPYDMLRYDSCWPVRQQDVLGAFRWLDAGRGDIRTVRLQSCSHTGPTEARWKSFGWRVRWHNKD